MSKFRIEHNASRTQLVPLKTNIEDTISNDIDLMASWSNNERRYIINELLRFALTQDEDFQQHKARASTATAQTPSVSKTTAASAKPASAPASRPNIPATVTAPGGAQR